MAMLLEATVQAVVAQIVKAIVNEAKYAVNFKSELEKMEKGLISLKACLKDADQSLKSEDISRIKVALSDLREVVYDADNAATDCLVREQSKKNRPMICSCLFFDDPLFPHGMGKRLKEINTRIKDVEDVLLRYLPGASGSNGNGRASTMSQHSIREFTMSQDFCAHTAYGLDADIDKLKGWMFDHEEQVNYIGIVGMGGLGKTTLAQKLFGDPQVFGYFDRMMWVCVSKNFSEERIMTKMLERVDKSTSPADQSGPNAMLGRVSKVLNGQSYLIVLDDVWPNKSNPYWLRNLCNDLPKPDGKEKKSCILITTRTADVAENMVLSRTQIHRHQPLNKEDSWNLFRESAFRATKGECPNDQLKVQAEHILEKCGGLPLAIKTIGSFLSGKVNTPSEWGDIAAKFHTLTIDGNNDEVISNLRLSYDELPITSLKQCLLCVSIYPEDFVIDAEQLVHWWIGEGLVSGTESKTAKEVGYEYLAELVNRCLVESVERRDFDGRVYKCKIHDMVREMIITIAADEAFCSFNGQGKLIQKEDRRWLCLSDDMEEDEKKLKDNPKLRTFFLMSSPPNDFGRNFMCLESLRVLDLSYSTSDRKTATSSSPALRVQELFSYISYLKRLACLNLSGSQEVTEVPSSIQKLLNLQLLILDKCCNLAKVDPSITRLKRLIVLNLGNCDHEYLPQGLGMLSLLQELTGFKVVSKAKTQGCALDELRQMKELRVLEIVLSADSEISENEMDVLSSLKMLRVLSIDAQDCTRTENLGMVDRLKLPSHLKELYLRNYNSAGMPNWFHPDTLPSLQYLCVENSNKLAKLTHDKSPWQIKGVCLKFLTFELEWEDLMKIMPELRYVEVSHCLRFENFLCSVEKRDVWQRKD